MIQWQANLSGLCMINKIHSNWILNSWNNDKLCTKFKTFIIEEFKINTCVATWQLPTQILDHKALTLASLLTYACCRATNYIYFSLLSEEEFRGKINLRLSTAGRRWRLLLKEIQFIELHSCLLKYSNKMKILWTCSVTTDYWHTTLTNCTNNLISLETSEVPLQNSYKYLH